MLEKNEEIVDKMCAPYGCPNQGPPRRERALPLWALVHGSRDYVITIVTSKQFGSRNGKLELLALAANLLAGILKLKEKKKKKKRSLSRAT